MTLVVPIILTMIMIIVIVIILVILIMIVIEFDPVDIFESRNFIFQSVLL
jgi:hypothetical protein